MSRSARKPAPFPSRDEILAFIRESDKQVGKREISRAFGLDADQKMQLKKILKEFEAEGVIGRVGKRRYGETEALPRVAVIEIIGTDTDGELMARPQAWPQESSAPAIYVAPEKRGPAALGPGERVLARLRPIGGGGYEARVIRRLQAAPQRALGIYREIDGHGRIKSIDKRAREDFIVAPGEDLGAKPGELVWAEVRRGRPLGPKLARVVERLGEAEGARSISLITIHDHDIPTKFSPDAWRQAESAGPAAMDGRLDLRTVPLVTIDGADARDFDDAVWAEADTNEANRDGWHAVVAIADVALYVRSGDPLDRDAYERGNSVYFPDRVVPMLPEALSNGWCSLVPGEDRPCLAVHLWIGRDGQILRHQFVRGMMRSAARLTYDQVQTAREGRPDDVTGPLLGPVIEPLYSAYEALAAARKARGVLELDIPERKVILDGQGNVEAIQLRERWDSHKLIEEFMIAANVAAAEAIEATRLPCMYRIHDQPGPDKLDSLREFLSTIGLNLPRGQVIRAAQFNHILEKAERTPYARLVHEVVLRSQAQAQYAPDNIGHFGLSLRRYAHFTSPIRRYADLLVHRALIAGARLGEGALPKVPGDFASMGEHLSATERRAATAERDAVDRFTAAFLAAKVGAVFSGRINGVTRFGLFVTLDDSGGDGLVPIRSLPDDFYVHDETRHELVGRTNRLVYRLGEAVDVRLVEADPITGSLILQLVPVGEQQGSERKSPRGKSRAASKTGKASRRGHTD
jgi:ribonuclease R